MAPQKRHKALQPLSREHHHGLLLAWKIRTGIKKNVEPKRIQKYALWFFNTHLIPHFKAEESYVFPVLKAKSSLVEKALNEHGMIKQLFEIDEMDYAILNEMADTLDNHIRFEERILFPEIQKQANEKQLSEIEKHHDSSRFEDNLTDEFWS